MEAPPLGASRHASDVLAENLASIVARACYNPAMKDAVVRARIASDLKEEAEEVFEELGLTTTEAIRMFLAQVRLRRGMPFSITLNTDNDDLLVSGTLRQSALDSVYDD